MTELHIALNEISPGGMRLVIDDQSLWTDPMREFGLKFRMASPLCAEAFLLPQADGCLVRGSLSGELVVPCNRCAEDAHIVVEQSFDEFEPYLAERKAPADEEGEDFEIPESSAVFFREGAPMLDLGGLLWEELSLALPVKPLCRRDCKGVCPSCGKNLNDGPCGCGESEGDPRLAALKHIKVKTKG